MPTKAEIRRSVSSGPPLPPDSRAEKSLRLCGAIAATAQWRAADTVAIFAPLPREPDVEMLWTAGGRKTFAYPRVNDGRLDLFRVSSLYDLQPGAFGVREPSPEPSLAVGPDLLDVIIVPGVAFTRGGLRLGRGGGFYDRLLAALPPRACRIGVCFDAQLLDELPVEPHDQPVDFVATESGIFPPG